MPPSSRGLWSVCPYSQKNRRSPVSLLRHLSAGRDDFFKVSEEVRDALHNGKPVVALETTIYTHGFPYPENVALSSHLESLVRVNGGIPATIGVLNGIARVGMQAEELIQLVSKAGKEDTMKVSRRDLGYIAGLGLAGKKLNGGTTIAGTMILAHLAGIKIFATGGLGGVHRGGENSLDISADLTELGRTSVAVISAGCKSFLDLPRTLEYLETQGVGIATFADGRNGSVDLPAFYVRDSGIPSPRTIKDETEAAAIIFAQSKLAINSGLWFAGPVPEKDSMTKEEVDAWVKEAVKEAESKGIHGSANTPYILDKIKQLSCGRSVIANRVGIAANVTRGTKVAVELAKLELGESRVRSRNEGNAATFTSSTFQAKLPKQSDATADKIISATKLNSCDVLVAGALASDLNCDYDPLEGYSHSSTPLLQTSNPAIFSQSVGGVGHNVALASHYAGASTLLCSVVGDDLTGRALVEAVKQSGLPTSGLQVLDASVGARTAQYVAINDTKKDLMIAMADMSILSSPSLDSQSVWRRIMLQHRPRWVVIDSNWANSIISHIAASAKSAGARIVFEPVSAQKSSRLCKLLNGDKVIPRHVIEMATPNIIELQNIFYTARKNLLFESEPWWAIIDALNLPRGGSRERFVQLCNPQLVDQGVPQQSLQLLPYIPCIVTKLGAQGCLVSQLLRPGDPRLRDPESAPYILGRASEENETVGGVYMRLIPPAELVKRENIVSVNGVGDTLLGVLVAGLAKIGPEARVEDLLPLAQEAAVRSLKSQDAVSKEVLGILGLSIG